MGLHCTKRLFCIVAYLLPYGCPHTPSCLYLLAIASYLFPEVSKIHVIKGISVVFDFVLAFFVFRCVRLKYSTPRMNLMPALAACAVLLAPTVILNSAMWGQSDAIYTSFLIACLYFLLAGRQVAAFIAFGMGFSVKLQQSF